jgi:hypothetical protein
VGSALGKLQTEIPAGALRVQPTSDEVRAQLRLILDSRAFHGSKRCQQFLEHVCQRALSGELDMLKERSIAVEVFGRNPESDFGEDTIVRVGARELRKRLAQYYGTAEGSSSAIRIEVPPGGYVPEFRYIETPIEHKQETAPVPVGAPPQAAKPREKLIAVGATLLLAAVAVVAIRSSSASSESTAFHRFWEPVFRSQDPLLLAVGHPLVYHASMRALKLNDELLPKQPWPMQRPLQIPPEQLDGNDLVPVVNQYVGFGDMVVATQVAGMLGKRDKAFRMRLASNVAFADLRKTQTLLIGAITNRWTMELGQAWRFRFDRIAGVSNVITDTQPGPEGQRHWSVVARADGLAPEDFVLISRIPNSSTGGLVVVAAGIKQFGTEAAGLLLTDPVLLDAVLSKLPSGWEKKNLQIVLSVKVIGNTPAQPEIVAWHVW